MTIFVVILSLAVVALAYGRFQDRKVVNELIRIREDEIKAQRESPSKFVCSETAGEVHRFANADLYLHLLAALEKALKREGYKITRSPQAVARLDTDASRRVAHYIATERCLYLAPAESPDLREEKVKIGERDGYNLQWLMLLSKGCTSQGWFIERCEEWPVHESGLN